MTLPLTVSDKNFVLKHYPEASARRDDEEEEFYIRIYRDKPDILAFGPTEEVTWQEAREIIERRTKKGYF